MSWLKPSNDNTVNSSFLPALHIRRGIASPKRGPVAGLSARSEDLTAPRCEGRY